MAELKIERHNWQPAWSNEIWIIDKRKQEEFQITLTQNEPEVEIEFNWDYGWGGSGSHRMIIPIKLLQDLLTEIQDTKNE